MTKAIEVYPGTISIRWNNIINLWFLGNINGVARSEKELMNPIKCLDETFYKKKQWKIYNKKNWEEGKKRVSYLGLITH